MENINHSLDRLINQTNHSLGIYSNGHQHHRWTCSRPSSEITTVMCLIQGIQWSFWLVLRVCRLLSKSFGRRFGLSLYWFKRDRTPVRMFHWTCINKYIYKKCLVIKFSVHTVRLTIYIYTKTDTFLNYISTYLRDLYNPLQRKP